ncbi:phosphoribosyltransferase [Youngiibacter fragilis]|uniref:Phosphoribosyl transferase n=1 Tax=Youngiibacter fragilis 232.1 TaxID=994573 RepID=V7IB61_9CLOT|nr:phosphoribosyltransferase family protein [Youngiibacter fragilis]ETA82556.1 phosphoribosyl transferase [Youngiibacter fragilis 232.1]
MFTDRMAAGKLLVPRILDLKLTDPVIIAIPRGGAEVAAPIAIALDRELYVVLARKLTVPASPDHSFGAVSPNGEYELDEKAAKELGLEERDILNIVDEAKAEVHRRSAIYEEFSVLPDLAGKDVVLVDDGIAKGYTTKVVVRYLRSLNPGTITLAVPALPKDSVELFSRLADRLVYIDTPKKVKSVGENYSSFHQVDHGDVLKALQMVKISIADC